MRTVFLTSLLIVSLSLNAYLLVFRSDNPQKSVAATTTAERTNTRYSSGTTYPFLRVVDGDTILVGIGERTEYVRLIGLNAPEPNDPGSAECEANEATAHLREIMRVGSVTLTSDLSQEPRDSYGRFFAYASLPGGIDVGEQMLRDGYAHEYAPDPLKPYERQTLYRQAEEAARSAKQGLWADTACPPSPATEVR